MNYLKHLLESIPIAIIAHDMNRKIFYFSRYAEKITGYSKEEVIGRDCHSVFPGGFCGSKCCFKNKIVVPTFSKLEYNIKFIDKKGNAKYLESKVVPIYNEKKIFGVCAIFEDITSDIITEKEVEKIANFHGIIGKTDKMQRLYAQIKNVSKISVPVLILGESGTGKELVANTIHKLSPRKDGPFVAVNCGAIPDSLIESELFGYVKGAFTGAAKSKKGRFELAHRGTLFLDEIGDVSPAMQVKLLRAIQTLTIERLGDSKKIRIDTRIITATNKDLRKEIEKGNFRKDLYYRIAVIPLKIPPLRERKEDIPLLVNHFLKEFAIEFNMDIPEISHAAIEILKRHNWPGNIRELQNVVQYSLVELFEFSLGVIEPIHLPKYLLEGQIDHNIVINKKHKPRKNLDLAKVEEAIKAAGGNKVKAAKMLGISRATLYRILDKYKP